MADFQDISARLKKAIKSSPVLTKAIKAALASYSRQQSSRELVVKAVDTATDTPAQQINDTRIYDLPRRFRFLNYAANHRPRVPQELLSLPMPESEVHSNPVVCKCTHNFLCKLHFQGKEILYLDSHEPSKQVNCQKLSPLKVLFGFMGES